MLHWIDDDDATTTTTAAAVAAAAAATTATTTTTTKTPTATCEMYIPSILRVLLARVKTIVLAN